MEFRPLVQHHEEKSYTAREDLHALAELGVRAGFVLVPAVPEPSLDPAHLPVQLLGEAVQMAGVWALRAQEDTTEFRVNVTLNYSQTPAP